MTDDIYESLNFSGDDDKKTELLDDTPAGEEKTTAIPPQQTGKEAPVYRNPYINSSDLRQPVRPAQPVQAQPAGNGQPVPPAQPVPPVQPVRPADPAQPSRESIRYSNPYQQPRVTPSSEPAVDRTPIGAQSTDDGFYHHRYSSQPGGNNMNYTRPSVPSDRSEPHSYSTHIYSDISKSEKKKSGGLSKSGIAILLVVCIVLSCAAGFGGSLIAQALKNSKYETNDSSTMVIHKVETKTEAGDSSDALVDKTTSEITTEVADTVVEITTESMQTSTFYGQYISQGAGSGVIISNDGYIITNNHVIDGATSIKVTTRGGDSYDAKLIGTDSKVDIALLKIEASDLTSAVFGDSSKLEVGSKAVIIGNPLGTLGGSVTEGIISALDRSIDIDGKTMHLMQTDAAINPGNSGGGMFNGQGELSGIVVAKSSSEEIDNIGFVIPINDVIDILDDLKDYGYVRGRADTGMTFIDLSNSMFAWYYYGSQEAGVYINSVESGSNAATAGFSKGDRVVSIDGNEISQSDDISTYIADKSAGDTVKFEISRNGNKMTLELTLDEDIPDAISGNSSGSSSSNGSDSDYGNGYPGGGNPFGGWFG